MYLYIVRLSQSIKCIKIYVNQFEYSKSNLKIYMPMSTSTSEISSSSSCDVHYRPEPPVRKKRIRSFLVNTRRQLVCLVVVVLGNQFCIANNNKRCAFWYCIVRPIDACGVHYIIIIISTVDLFSEPVMGIVNLPSLWNQCKNDKERKKKNNMCGEIKILHTATCEWKINEEDFAVIFGLHAIYTKM